MNLGMKLKILCIYCFADYLKLLLANDYNYYGTPTKIVQILDLSPANKTCSTLKLFPDSGKKNSGLYFVIGIGDIAYFLLNHLSIIGTI